MKQLLRTEEITKEYTGVIANHGISITLDEGEVHTLVGENGAGKTTLCKILYGEIRPDAGDIWVDGKKVSFQSPLDAIRLRIGMVHQDFRLIPQFNVTENMVLGEKSITEILGIPLLDVKAFAKKILELSERFGLKIDPTTKVGELSAGEKQRVELLKALYRDAKVLILDEPTSVLTPKEVIGLFSTLRSMVNQGLSIVFTTHKLDEAMRVSDRITVLRQGKVIAERKTSETNEGDLARLMVGRDVLFEIKKERGRLGAEVLRAENISAIDDRGFRILKDFSLQLREGEIVGIAGVAGNGQKELAEALARCRKISSGSLMMKVNEQPELKNLTRCSAKDAIRLGIAHITDEPLRTGVISNLTVAENIMMKNISNFSHAGLVNDRSIREFSQKLIKEFSIKAQDPNQPTKDLSGGNIQRLVIARELSLKGLKVLIACNPTKGLDIAATEFIRNKLLNLRKEGIAILLISEDLQEILSLSDRIAVIFNGQIVGLVESTEANIEEIGLMMTGVKGNGKS